MTTSSSKARLFFLLIMLNLSSCSIIGILGPPNNEVRNIALAALQGANDNQPVAVDVVFVYSKELAAAIQSLTANDWFRQKQEYLSVYPGTIKFMHWELVPESLGTTQLLPPDSSDALAVIAFAAYTAAGTHAIDITGVEEVTLQLGARAMSLILDTRYQ